MLTSYADLCDTLPRQLIYSNKTIGYLCMLKSCLIYSRSMPVVISFIFDVHYFVYARQSHAYMTLGLQAEHACRLSAVVL